MTGAFRLFVSFVSAFLLQHLCFQNSDRYVVDAADRDSVPISKSELHELLMKPSLSGIPLLVLGNKIDKSEALSQQTLVDLLLVYLRTTHCLFNKFSYFFDVSFFLVLICYLGGWNTSRIGKSAAT